MNQAVLDHIWLWCHNAGVYNRSSYNLPGESQATPIEALKGMGIKNAVMVVYGNQPEPPFDKEAAQFAGIDRLAWSIIGDGGSKRNDQDSDLKHVINLKKKCPNLQAAIMDDFFAPGRQQLDKVAMYAERLHQAGLKLWVVLYGHQLDSSANLQEFLQLCDVISFWTWRGEELPLLEARLQTLRSMAPDKQIALGCYMWDFGAQKELSSQNMQFQCELALQQLKIGLASEIVLLGSPLWGIDIEAQNWTCKWLRQLRQD